MTFFEQFIFRDGEPFEERRVKPGRKLEVDFPGRKHSRYRKVLSVTPQGTWRINIKGVNFPAVESDGPNINTGPYPMQAVPNRFEQKIGIKRIIIWREE